MIQNNIKRLLFIPLTVLLLSCRADGHELSGGYTKLLSLHASENISASGLRADGDRYRSVFIPWHSDGLYTTEGLSTGVYLRGSYIDVKSPVNEGELFRWQAYGLMAGGDMTFSLSDRFSLRGGMGVGYARVYNRSINMSGEAWDDYLGWKRRNVFLASPELEGIFTNGDFSLRSGVSLVWLSELAAGRGDIGSRAGTYSVRMAYTLRDVVCLTGRCIDLTAENHAGGFYGPGRKTDLGFSVVNETRLVAAVPLRPGGQSPAIKAGPGVFVGNGGARGVSFTLGMTF